MGGGVSILTDAIGDELRALEASLERRHRTRETVIPLIGHEIRLLHPANADELISEADFVADGRLPYWADLWPASRVLAAHLLANAGAGRRLLELGCGSGLVATAAQLAGYDVTATDYYADACDFARINGWRASGRDLRAHMLDWRQLPADLGTWDVVVASDVLYEHPYAPLVAAALARTIAPTGVAWVADPGRTALPAFLSACKQRALETGEPQKVAYDLDGQRQEIRIFTIRHAAR